MKTITLSEILCMVLSKLVPVGILLVCLASAGESTKEVACEEMPVYSPYSARTPDSLEVTLFGRDHALQGDANTFTGMYGE
jgi:hypothetical protein